MPPLPGECHTSALGVDALRLVGCCSELRFAPFLVLRPTWLDLLLGTPDMDDG